MSRGFLRRRLGRRPWRVLLSGVGISLCFVAALALLLWDARRGTFKRNEFLSILILTATGSALGLLLTGWAAVHLGWVYDHRHRDLRALGRYGPPPEVVVAIDAEVVAGRRLVRLGTLPTLLNPVHEPGVLRGHEVILTESWLLDFWRQEGDRCNAMRLTDLVRAAQEEPGVSGAGLATLVLTDRHGVGLCINGTEAAVGRLLAEVLARVPWVLGRFEPQPERAGPQGRGGTLAEEDRREQVRRADVRRGPPPTPT
jgi:hypothetical protein